MVGLIIFGIGSVLMIIAGIPLMLRKIKPNFLYGFRVRSTLENPKIWYEANAYAGKLLVIIGILSLIPTFALYPVFGYNKDYYAGFAGGTIMMLLLILLILSFVKLSAIKEEFNEDSQEKESSLRKNS